MSMPDQRSHYLAAAVGHHLEPLARSEREKEVEFELAFPFGIVVGQLQNHSRHYIASGQETQKH
jgi:hypothetical protein